MTIKKGTKLFIEKKNEFEEKEAFIGIVEEDFETEMDLSLKFLDTTSGEKFEIQNICLVLTNWTNGNPYLYENSNL